MFYFLFPKLTLSSFWQKKFLALCLLPSNLRSVGSSINVNTTDTTTPATTTTTPATSTTTTTTAAATAANYNNTNNDNDDSSDDKGWDWKIYILRIL